MYYVIGPKGRNINWKTTIFNQIEKEYFKVNLK